VASSASKLLDFRWFAGALAAYELAPKKLARTAAAGVVTVEGASGVLLVAAKLMPWPAYAAAGLFACFAVAIGINLVRGRFNVACGCSALWKNSKIGWHLLIRNLGLCGLALLSAERHFTPGSVPLLVAAIALTVGPLIVRVVLRRRQRVDARPAGARPDAQSAHA